jgi:CheY-like chemotaxis protein
MATILVCDDHELIRDLVHAALAEGDHTIIEARDGRESLELARELHPDLIILDLVMPARSGLDVLEELRCDPSLAATPVLMSTASTRSLDPRSASELGADRYLAKPFSPLELATVVAELLEARPNEPTAQR